jgi:hypothetical protein
MLYHCNSIVTYSWPFLALFSNIGDLRLMLSFNNDIVPLLFGIFSSFMMPAIIQYINALSKAISLQATIGILDKKYRSLSKSEENVMMPYQLGHSISYCIFYLNIVVTIPVKSI